MANIFKVTKRANTSNTSNTSRKNFFKVLESDDNAELSKGTDDFFLAKENFPSLGKESGKPNVITSFSSVLNKEQKEKEKEINTWAGWIVMKMDVTQIIHEGGERCARVSRMLEEMKEIKIYNKYVMYIEKCKIDKKINEYLNGPEYINSWEVDEYLDQIEKENEKYNEFESDEEDYMSE